MRDIKDLESPNVKQWVPDHYWRTSNTWADCDMPRIRDEFLYCSIYLYPSEQAAVRGESAGGSGFLVLVPSERMPQVGAVYAVTNSHVIANGTSFIRVNTGSGGTEVIPTQSALWTHSEDADIAVYELDLGTLKSDYELNAISTKWFLSTREKATDKGLGPGDETFVVGRFINHEGLQQNRPSVRFGTIAVMPDEKDGIYNKHVGKSCEAFLVETHTIAGYSGSPVFFHIPPGSWRPPHAPNPGKDGWRGPWLLGVDFGHVPIYEPVFKKNADGSLTDTVYQAEVSTGMMCVAPAWKLTELLNDEHLVESRRKLEEKIIYRLEKKGGARLEVAKSSGDKSVAKVRDEALRTMLSTPPQPRAPRALKRVKRK